MGAPPGYESEELTYAQRNPQTIMLSDGVRSRKTDTAYVVEIIDQNGTWLNSGVGTLSLSVAPAVFNFGFLPTDFARYIDTTDGAVTGTLPAATGSGKIYLAVKIDDTANVATIAAYGSDLIDGASSINLVDQWADCLIQDAASGYWHQIGKP